MKAGRSHHLKRVVVVLAAHYLSKHPDPVKYPLVKATFKCLSKDYEKAPDSAKGGTPETMAAVKATARIQHAHQGKHRLKESGIHAINRALVDLALL